ncbi:hypothetical protein H4R18_000070 [Coemansia javaensis]|uniref:Uncharacterized protein n=1 Tax=Coemansia javaensis TaxID=2761396 RepID=A0A9W8LNE1_9FUNG|nr:hypothetical protein H4R18_000070 [Coemansia javaensis]
MPVMIEFYNGVFHPIEEYTNDPHDNVKVEWFVNGLTFDGELIKNTATLYHNTDRTRFVFVQKGAALPPALFKFVAFDSKDTFKWCTED